MNLKTLRWIIPIVLVASLTFAWEGNVSYIPPDANTDGTLLLEQELDFYTLYCEGAAIGTIDSIIGQRTVLYDFGALASGDHSCNLTVTNLAGVESAFSNTAVFTIGPRTPNAPTGLVILPL